MSEASPKKPIEIFFSYSQKDEKLRDRLETHLATLKRQGLISGWHDRKITAGNEWKGAIDEHLKSAGIILLLVSADFLNSDYCNDVELTCALGRHERGDAQVIPVILHPCDWKNANFAHLQSLPINGKPVSKWTSRDDAFLSVVEGIRKALQADKTAAPTSQAVAVPPSPPATGNALHQLHAPPADFTGRAEELAELLDAIRKNGVIISGLQGLGGVGKTALALKLADHLKTDYPDAQFYLDLKGASENPLTPKAAMEHVIRAYQPTAQLADEEAKLGALYRSLLDGKRALLLMDNARDAAQVQPLIPPASCLLLVTSRRRFALPGLVEKNLDALSPGDAEKILLKIAARLEKEEPGEVAELARLCGYLPLALRAVGSALQVRKNISPGDYIRRLGNAQQRLKLTETDAALQSSYELLTDDLRREFRCLAAFPDTFDQAAVAAVWKTNPDEALDHLGELLSYSLCDFDEESRRYRLHDLVRLFAGQQLDVEERNVAQQRHARHYLQVLAFTSALYLEGGNSVKKGLALFDLEWSNIQAGQAWAATHVYDDDEAGAESCWKYPDAGIYCLHLRQHPRERIHWLEDALAAARRLGRRDLEGNALGNLGLACGDLGEYRRAIEFHEKALVISREIADRRGEGQDLGSLGNAYHNLGEYNRAIKYLEQHLEIACALSDRRGEGTALGNLGIAYNSLGEYRRAIEYHEQALLISREIADRLGEGQDLGNLGNAYDSLGEYARAIEYHEQALTIDHEIGDRRGEGQDLGNLGSAYYSLGQYRRAIGYHERQLKIAREIGDRLGEGEGLWNSALAFDQLGNRFEAIVRAEAALKIREAIESPHAGKVREQLARWRKEEKGKGAAAE